MKLKTLMIAAGVVAVLFVIAGSFSAGIVAGQTIASTNVLPYIFSPHESNFEEYQEVIGPAVDTSKPENNEELFEPFWQAWNLIEENYVDQPVDEEMMMRGAIHGLLDSLGDPHTAYMDPEIFELTSQSLDGVQYEGIGAWVDITGDYLSIISPMPGSPAEKAGLRPNDKVIAVDGDDMTSVDGEAVRQRIIGPKGTVVVLTIQREGLEEPFDVKITRESIDVPTVEQKMLDENIAYIRLYTFGDDTTQEMRKALKKLLSQKPDGLILDLRYNGGGYLDTALEVASEFIDDGVLMYEEFSDGSRDEKVAKEGGHATDIPLVILINEGSASASEIVAGAIQDRERGVLVGMTSFGKGSVQNIIKLINDEGAVRITVARWLTPIGRQINGVGLEPDFIVEFTDEDVLANRDPQLEKAIELLLEKVESALSGSWMPFEFSGISLVN